MPSQTPFLQTSLDALITNTGRIVYLQAKPSIVKLINPNFREARAGEFAQQEVRKNRNRTHASGDRSDANNLLGLAIFSYCFSLLSTESAKFAAAVRACRALNKVGAKACQT